MSVKIQSIPCGMIQENVYIVQAEGRNDCVVVDPGDECPKLLRTLGERRVGAVLLTHGHFDHIMAVAPLAGHFDAPVYVSAEDMEMLNDAAKNGYANLMGMERIDWPEISARPFDDALEVCGMRFAVLPTPGHSKGSVCLYLKDEDTLFSGDTLFRAGYGRMDLYGGNLNEMIRSLKRLMELPEGTRVYPGHGEPTTIGEERARYRL